MLEVSTLRSPSSADQRGFVGDHVIASATDCGDDFMVDDSLLDYIDFSCCDVPSFFDADGDILPDLEVDPTELLAEFSPPADGCRRALGDVKEAQKELFAVDEKDYEKRLLEEADKKDVVRKDGEDEVFLSALTTEDSAAAGSDTRSSASAEGHSNQKKPSASAKNSHGKRKVKKVDWTPELHRRFVQAVEQLGIDKAVPSRILEIMGIECLTRHNIASHLQKYRSHRKHLMAREAEAASWAQKRRQMHAATKDMPSPAAAGPPWVVLPTVGFPPPPFGSAGRPLHVWGHPPTAVEAAARPPAVLPVWPRHLAPPVDLGYYWGQQYNAARKWGPQAVTQGTPCLPPPAVMRLPPVTGMVPHPMYRPMVPPPPPQSSKVVAGLQLQLDAHPSKESIDAAIGDVLVKPWLPLPLGLKPPSLDSVMSELHKQGIPKVPPAPSTTGS